MCTLGFVASSDIKAQEINIRMTKIASRDPPPHYPIQDILLMKQLVLMGLIHNYGLGHEREMEESPHIKILFLIDSHSDFERRLQDDSDCIIQINKESSASVFLWTR
jgi:hypothetical protein